MNDEHILETPKSQNLKPKNVESNLTPTSAELAVLSVTEKIGYKLTDRMNRGAWKQFGHSASGTSARCGFIWRLTI